MHFGLYGISDYRGSDCRDSTVNFNNKAYKKHNKNLQVLEGSGTSVKLRLSAWSLVGRSLISSGIIVTPEELAVVKFAEEVPSSNTKPGWSAISSSIRKSRPSDKEREFDACVGVPGLSGVLPATENKGNSK